MKLRLHPEYENVYLRHHETHARCHEALEKWRESGRSIVVEQYALTWNFQSAQAFAQSLAAMLQAYNQIVWKQFPYCGPCGGQCCLVNASDVAPFDMMALTLLDQPMPILPDRIAAAPRDCIYRTAQGCAWSSDWRTLKCWFFYCLGNLEWELAQSMDKLYQAMAEALTQIIRPLLPEALHRYEAVHQIDLCFELGDPLTFHQHLDTALNAILVKPFNAHYPIFRPESLDHQTRNQQFHQTDGVMDIFLLESDLMVFIADTSEGLAEGLPPVPPSLFISEAQLRDDLESLEWIMLGQPQNGAQVLAAMYQRYAAAPSPLPEEEPSLWYQMRQHVLALWQQISRAK